jgi:hypothetical protein
MLEELDEHVNQSSWSCESDADLASVAHDAACEVEEVEPQAFDSSRSGLRIRNGGTQYG